MKKCADCGNEYDFSRKYCGKCGSSLLAKSEEEEREEQRQIELKQAKKAEETAIAKEIMERAKTMRVFTVFEPKSINVKEELGIVFGNSSKQAFWGLSTQANRLSRAYDAALLNLKYDAAALGADAVIGVTFALNNSTGSSAVIIAGSSEAVMLLGTAVKTH